MMARGYTNAENREWVVLSLDRGEVEALLTALDCAGKGIKPKGQTLAACDNAVKVLTEYLKGN